MLQQNKTYLFAYFLLLLEIVVLWNYNRTNGAEIGMQQVFSNVEINSVITGEVQKSVMKRSIVSDFSTSSTIAQRTRNAYYDDSSNKSGKITNKVTLDFNPALLIGYRGGPGIKIRANQRSFQYMNALISQILDSQIVEMQLPDVQQKIAEFSADITICNLYVSNYRPPKSLNIYPESPNLIVLHVDDLDIGVTGNLNGVAQILLLPIQLNGIVYASFYQVSATIKLMLERSASGVPQIVLCECDISISYADVCIECGGILGDLANLFFRQKISEQTRLSVPSRICSMLPGIINERINPLLARLPRSIQFIQMANIFTEFLDKSIPAHCRLPQCQAHLAKTKSPSSKNAVNASPTRNRPPSAMNQIISGVTSLKKRIVSTMFFVPVEEVPQQVQPKLQSNSRTRVKRAQLVRAHNDDKQVSNQIIVLGIRNKNKNHAKSFVRNGLIMRNNAQSYSQQKQLWQQQLRKQLQQKAAQKLAFHTTALRKQNSGPVSASRQYLMTSADRSHISVANGVSLAKPISKEYNGLPEDYKWSSVYQSGSNVGNLRGVIDPCAGCRSDPSSDSFDAIVNQIKQQLNLKKLANLIATIELLRSYATSYDYNLDFTGEFTPNGVGGTPFGPYPMQWPTAVGSSMIEILISDFTINSLLYWMHRANFLSFRIGPETPSIGALLTTTCDFSSDYAGEGFENKQLLSRLLHLSRHRRRYIYQQRSRRQAISINDSNASSVGSLGDLADLGICLGDILPAVKEKYPNKTLALLIYSARSPSIKISGHGNIQLDLVLFIGIYLDKTNIRVGTITVTALADLMVRIMGCRINANASLPVLKLMDRDQTLGLQQETFDNLASLAKDVVLKIINQQLSRGIEISLPTSNLPINIVNLHTQLLEHAFYIGSDFTITPSAIPMFS